MKKIAAILLVIGSAIPAYSQSSGTGFMVTATALLDVSFADDLQLETGITLANAIMVQTPAGKRPYQLTARLVTDQSSAGIERLLAVRTTQGDGQREALAGVALERSEKVVNRSITQKKVRGITSYDFVVRPPGYSVRPGAYTFSIIFTLTDDDRRLIGEQTLSGSVTVPVVQMLDVTETSRGETEFSDLSNLVSGITIPAFYHLRIRSNVAWIVTQNSYGRYFEPLTSGSSTTMPVSVLSLRTPYSKGYLPLSITATPIASGGAAISGKPNGIELDCDLRMQPGLNYNGGSYFTGVVFSISSP